MISSLPGLQRLAVALVAIAPLSASSFAQTTATTDPVGFITLNVDGAGTAGAAGKTSFKGLGLTRPVEYQGSAETVGANTLADNEASWSDNQFNGTNGKFYVEIASGPAAGTTYDITGTTAATKTLTLGQNLGANVAAGVTFKIRKHWTLAAVFGPNNEAGLGGGTSTTADQIMIFNGTGYDVYFYQVDPGIGNGWRSASDLFADAAQTVIYPDDGLIINRKQANSANVVLMGAVKTGPTSFPIFNGTNVIANVYVSPLTLSSSGLYTGNTSTGVTGGSASTADEVLIWNGTGYDVYFYQVDSGIGNGWRSANDLFADAGTTQIPVGASVIIKRKSATGFNWVVPQHPASL